MPVEFWGGPNDGMKDDVPLVGPLAAAFEQSGPPTVMNVDTKDGHSYKYFLALEHSEMSENGIIVRLRYEHREQRAEDAIKKLLDALTRQDDSDFEIEP